MAKRVFFSFHYDDVKMFRANVVRKHDMLKTREEAGFFDASIWEDAKRHGDLSVKRLINSSLENTSVTCVLIGTETWRRRWVRYEILRSYDRGNKLFGVHINTVRDRNQQILTKGLNPFKYLGFRITPQGNSLTYYERETGDWRVYEDLPKTTGLEYATKHCGKGYTLSDWVPIYDWTRDKGYENFPDWVENAV